MTKFSKKPPDKIQTKCGVLLLVLLGISGCRNIQKQSADSASRLAKKSLSPPPKPSSNSPATASSSTSQRPSSAALSSTSPPATPAPHSQPAPSGSITAEPTSAASTTKHPITVLLPKPALSSQSAHSGSVLPSKAQHSAPTTADVEQIEVVVRAIRMQSVLQTAAGKEAIGAIGRLLGEYLGGKHTIEPDIKQMISDWALQLSYVPDVDQKSFDDFVQSTLDVFKKKLQAALKALNLKPKKLSKKGFFVQKRRLHGELYTLLKKLYTLLIAAGTNKDACRLSSNHSSKASNSDPVADVEQGTKPVVQRMYVALQKAEVKIVIKAIEETLGEYLGGEHTIEPDIKQIVSDWALCLSCNSDIDQQSFDDLVQKTLDAYKERFQKALSSRTLQPQKALDDAFYTQLRVWYSDLYITLLKAGGVNIATSLKVQHIDIATEVAQRKIELSIQEVIKKEKEWKEVIEAIENVLKEYLGSKRTIEPDIEDFISILVRKLSDTPDVDQQTFDSLVENALEYYEGLFQKALRSGKLKPQKALEELFYPQLEALYKRLYAIILAAGADTVSCQLASLVPSKAQRVDTATEIAHIKAAVKGLKERMRSALQNADGKQAVEEIESILKEYLGEKHTNTELDTEQIISDLALRLSYNPKVGPKRIAAIVDAKLDTCEERFQKALSSGTLQPQKALDDAFYDELEIWYKELYTILLKAGGVTVARPSATNPLLLK